MHEINESIKDPQIRLIGENGEQLGIMSSDDAIRIANDKEMDLVKISSTATPPVCKLMDYAKYCYNKKKREKEARRNSKVVDTKEIRMRPYIDTADYATKLRSAVKFLESGKRVKVSVMFRGREMAHTKLGSTLLRKFAEDCQEFSTYEGAPVLNGRNMIITLSPK